MQNLCMSTNEEYEKIAVTIDSEASENSSIGGEVRVVPVREDNSLRHNVLVSRWEASRRHCQRWSEIHSSRRRSRPSSRYAQDSAKTRCLCQTPRPGELHSKQLRRPQGTAGPTILTGGSKETQEQLRSNKRLVFTGGACDECEARKTEELVGLEERAESTHEGACAERRRIQQTLLIVWMKTSSRNCVVAKS